MENKVKMKPMSIMQHVISIFGGTSVRYPAQCRVCGIPTKGNIVTGYYLPCDTALGDVTHEALLRANSEVRNG